MSWWSYIPAVLTGASAVYNSSQIDDAAETTNMWETFNANMSYQTTQDNIAAQSAIAQYNASAVLAAAQIDASLAIESSQYNAEIIAATTIYNDALYENELTTLWNATGLDQLLLSQQRARERGSMIATQASSGVLINDGSSAKVIVDQMTQENLDAMVIQYGADVKAADIANARAKGMWEGQMAVQKTLWEGRMTSYKSLANSQIQANSILTEDAISSAASLKSAQSQFWSDSMGAIFNQQASSQSSSNTLVNGLFGAASSAVGAYTANELSLLS